MVKRFRKQASIPQVVRIEPLEPRVLYSAESAPLLALLDPEQNTSAIDRSSNDSVFDRLGGDYAITYLSDQASTTSLFVTEVVLVDNSHDDINELLNLLQSQQAINEQTAIVTLDGNVNAMASITDILSRFDNLDAIHIVSHASDGTLLIGQEEITQSTLVQSAPLLKQWGDALSKGGDILLYGCNLSATDDGHAFVRTLANLSGADVASSSDVTGHALQSGDWDLEIIEGHVETDIAFGSPLQSEWQGSLDIVTGLVHHYRFDGNGNDSVGAADAVMRNDVSYVVGEKGYGAEFEPDTSGTLAMAEVPAERITDFGTGNFSVSLWAKTIDGDSYNALVTNSDSGSSGFQLSMSDGLVKFEIFDGTTSSSVTSTEYVDWDIWVQIVAQRVGDSLTLTLLDASGFEFDSVSGGFNASTINVNSTQSLKFAAAGLSKWDYDGALDDIRLYSRELTATDILELNTVAIGPYDPVLIVNTGVVVEEQNSAPVTSAMLEAIDADNFPGQILYSIISMNTDVRFTLDGGALNFGNTFTQDDIDQGRVGVTANLGPQNPPVSSLDISMSVAVNDIDTQVFTNTAIVNVTVVFPGVNSAPIAGNASIDVSENAPSPAGETIANIVGPVVMDTVGDYLLGILVNAVPDIPAQGIWQYSTDGLNWYSMGLATNTNALALSSTSHIRFLPAPNYIGPAPALNYHALDSSYEGVGYPDHFTEGENRVGAKANPNGGSTAISASAAKIDANVLAVNDPPVFTQINLPATISETKNTGEIIGSVVVSDEENHPITLTLGGTDASYFTINTANELILTSPLDHASQSVLDIIIFADDSAGARNSIPHQFLVDNVNEAPSVVNTELVPVAEDTLNPAGTTVATLLQGSFSDPDLGDSLSGIAVTGNTLFPAGDWQYSTDGITWQDIGGVSINSAVVLADNHLLRYLPSLNYNGTPPPLEIKALDQSYTGAFSTNGSPVTIDANGSGQYANISQSTALVSTVVTPVNDPPTLPNAKLASIAEDTVHPAGANFQSLFAPGFQDVDPADNLLGVVVIGDQSTPAEGHWEYTTSGSIWVNVGVVSPTQGLLLTDSASIRFVPGTNFNGVPGPLELLAIDSTYTGIFSDLAIREEVDTTTLPADSAIGKVSAFLNTQVTPVNDAPLAVDDSYIATRGVTLSGNVLDNDIDVDSSILSTTRVQDASNGTLTLNSDGSFVYDFGGGVVNTDQFSYQVSDGSFFSIATVNISISQENAPPEFQGVNVLSAISEQDGFTIAGTIGAVDPDGDTVTFSLTGADAGLFSINTNNQLIVPTSVDHELHPSLDIILVASDSNGGVSTSPHTITVDDVNEAPSISSASLAGIVEDSVNPPGASVSDLFLTTFTDPDVNAIFSGIAVTGNTVNSAGAWQYSTDGVSWQAIGGVSLNASVVLAESHLIRYLPSTNFSGTPPPLEIKALDQDYTGGFSTNTAVVTTDGNGSGAFTYISEASVSLNTVVSPVNDRPDLDQVLLHNGTEDEFNPPGLTFFDAFAESFVDNDADNTFAGVVIVDNPSTVDQGQYEYSLNGSDWMSVGNVSVANALVLESSVQVRFVPAANFNGTSGVLEFYALDSTWVGGYTDNLVRQEIDVSAIASDSALSNTTASLFVAVAPVQDPPVAVADSFNATEGVVMFGNVTTNDNDADNETLSVALVDDVLEGALTLNTDGSFSYTYAAGNSTSDRFTYTLSDGISTSAITTVDITITPVNDPPQLSVVAMSAIPENAEPGTVVGTIVFSDPDNDLVTITIDSPANSVFGINDNELVLQTALDAENTSLVQAVVRATDEHGLSTLYPVSFPVTNVNEAPTIASASLAGVSEDTLNPPGASLTNLYLSTFSDPDPNAVFTGVAITSNTISGNGAWQYSTNGTTWEPIGTVSSANALVLATTDLVRFVPSVDYHGTPFPLLLRGLDDGYAGTFSSPGAPVYISANGVGQFGYISEADVQLQTAVTPVDDRPTIPNASLPAIAEDEFGNGGQLINDIYLTGFVDADVTDLLAGIAIVGDASEATQGGWEYSLDQTTWLAVGQVSQAQALMLANSAYLRFVPAADFNGVPGALSLHAIDDSVNNSFTNATSRVEFDMTSAALNDAFSFEATTLDITVNAVNDPPVGILDSYALNENSFVSGNVLTNDVDTENDALTATLVTLPSHGSIVLDIDGGFTYNHNGSENVLDFFEYVVSDGLQNSNIVNVELNINPVNDAPYALLQSSPLTVSEDALNSTVVGTVQAADTDSAELTYSLVNDAGGRFSVDSGTGVVSVADATLLDFESESVHTITVRVTDDASSSLDAAMDVTVTDVNDAPYALEASGPLLVTENESDITIASFNGYDVDDSTLTYSVIGEENRFQFDGNNLMLVPGLALDYETEINSTITVQVADAGGLTFSKAFAITLVDVNESPQITATALMAINEDDVNPAGVLISALYANNYADVDRADSLHGIVIVGNSSVGEGAWQYRVTGGSWSDIGLVSASNALLLSAQSELRFVPAPDFHGVPTNLTVFAIDSNYAGTLTTADSPVYLTDIAAQAQASVSAAPADISIVVNPINDAPQLELNSLVTTLAETVDTSAAINLASIVVLDVDGGANEIALTGQNAGLFQISSTGDMLQLQPGVVLNSETISQLEVRIAVSDPNLTNGVVAEQTYTLAIVGVNEAPLLLAIETDNLLYPENSNAIPITETIVVTEPDAAKLNAAQIRFSSGFEPDQDRLLYSGLNGIIGEFDRATGVLMLSGTASALEYQDAIRSIAYLNLSDRPTLDVRNVDIVVSDVDLQSNVLTRSIIVESINDEQQVMVNTGTSLEMNAIVQLTTNMLSVQDLDNVPSEIVYSKSATWTEMELLVAGVASDTFTQEDLAAGVVELQSSGVTPGVQSLALVVDDGSGEVSAINFEAMVNVIPAPEIAAATPEPITTITETMLSEVPPVPIAKLVSKQPAENEQLEENTQILGDISPETGSELLAMADSETNKSTSSTSETRVALASISIPVFPVSLATMNFVEIVNETSAPEKVIKNKAPMSKLEVAKMQMASLLSLEPITIDSIGVYENLESNSGFLGSIDKMQKELAKSSQTLENSATVRDTIVGFSLSVTAGFLVWMLRGGALLASMFSISPLWKQLDPLPIVNANNGIDSVKKDEDKVEDLFSNR